jgi:hypothetical protein
MNSGPLPVADQLGSSAAAFGDLFEGADGVVGSHLPSCRGCERLAGVLVGNGEDLERPAVGGLVDEEVDRPDLVWTSCSQMARHPRSVPAPPRLWR